MKSWKIHEINKKHPSIKFDEKYSKSKIEFLDVLVYKNQQQRLQLSLFKKKQTANLSSRKTRPSSVAQKRYTVQSKIACQKTPFNKQRRSANIKSNTENSSVTTDSDI